MNKAELEKHRQVYDAWARKYGPLTFLEFDSEGGENFQRAKNTPPDLVWTNHATCEDDQVTAGFKFFGDPPDCCWITKGWYVTETSSGFREGNDSESYRAGAYAHCECFDEDKEQANPDCDECLGDGWVNYYFD